MKKYGEILNGAVVFLIAAAYFAMAFGIKQFNAGQPGIITSDFMPKIYGTAVMLLGAIQILRGVAGLKAAPNVKAQDTDGPPIGILLTFALLVGYVALLQTVGFVIMSILFAVGLSCLLLPEEKRGKRTYLVILAVSAIFTIAITVIFVKGFHLTLPMGLLG